MLYFFPPLLVLRRGVIHDDVTHKRLVPRARIRNITYIQTYTYTCGRKEILHVIGNIIAGLQYVYTVNYLQRYKYYTGTPEDHGSVIPVIIIIIIVLVLTVLT